MADDRARLLSILRDGAVTYGDFVLSSGLHSNYYIDARPVTLSGVASPLIGRLFLEQIRREEADAVAGLTLGADPIVSAVVTISGLGDRPLDGLIVRKEAKGHGQGRLVEGPWREGMRVAVVEDAVTTGASILRAARAVADHGGVITGLYGLIDRDQGGREAIEAEGYAFHTIYNVNELVG